MAISKASILVAAFATSLAVIFLATGCGGFSLNPALSKTPTITSTITWNTPPAITYGTALSGAQLNATSTVAGTFAYTPALGTVLGAGTQTLSVTFTPTDTTDYSPTTETVPLQVNKAALTVTASSPTVVFGSPVPKITSSYTGLQNGDSAAVVTVVPTCTTTYTAASLAGSSPTTSCSGGTVSSNYSFKYINGSVTITKGTPAVSWATPATITYGTALSAVQLDATSGGVSGSYAYTPVLGTVLTVGSHTLSVAFTPTDATDYNTAAANVSIAVNPAAPPSLNGIYYSLLQTYDLNASNGLSNTSEGVVAAEEGTPGTGTIVLPQPIDPTRPWRLNIHFVFNDANPFTIRFENPGNQFSGYSWSSNGSMDLYAGWNNGQYLTYGPLTSVPTGTPMSFTVASDGFGVWPCVIPDTLTTVFSDMPYAANWDGSEYCGEMSASFVDPVYGALNQDLQVIAISNASTENTITGIYLSQGNLDPPPDREMVAPMILNPAVALDPGGYGPPSRFLGPNTQIFVPGSYSAQSGAPVVLYHHPNGYFNINSVAFTSVAALVNEGYVVIAPNTWPNSVGRDFTNGLTSNWGAPSGELWRKAAEDWARANLPDLGQLYHFGYSMGCMDALEYEQAWPGSAAIICVSGVTSLTNAYNQTGNPFGAIIDYAYGDWYVALQPSTGENPASTTGYWKKVATGPDGLPAQYLTSGYTYLDYWQSGIAYSSGQFVNTPFTGGVGALSAFDPTLNPDTYLDVPIYLSGCPGDTTISPSEWSTFQTAVNSAGGNVTLNLDNDGTCGHGTQDLFSPDMFISFFNTYRRVNAQ